MEPSGESQRREETPGSGPGCGQTARRAAPPRPPAAAGQDRAEEEPLGAAAPELPAPASQAAAPESAGEDGRRPQPAPPEARGAEDPAAPPSSEAVTGPEQAPPAPGAHPAPAPRRDLQLPLPDASADPPAHRELKEPPPQPEGRLAPEGRGDPDPRVSREAEDYLSSLLAGCLRGAEDSPSGEEEDDPDLLPDLSPDEASYSLQDDPPSPSDGSLSLDDLARRIEVAGVSARPGMGDGRGCAAHCTVRTAAAFISPPPGLGMRGSR